MYFRSSRISRSGWSAPILAAQRELLNLHARTFTWEERPVTLANKHTINVVIARPLQEPQGLTSRGVLMLLHGWGGGLGLFARAVDHLAPHFRAIYLVDLPGMGASSRPVLPLRDADEALHYFLQDLDGMYEHLAVSDPLFRASTRFLAAHSLGGYLAAEWMLRDPDRFAQLVLVSPVGVPQRPAQRGGDVRRAVRAAIWNSGLLPQDVLRILPKGVAQRYCNAFVRSHFDFATDRPESEEKLLTDYLYHASVAPTAGERAVSVLLAPGAWAVRPLHARLPHLAVPCTFVYGARDWMDWRAGERARHGMSTPTRLVRVDQAGHNVHMDNAAGFASSVVAALSDE